jgi:hypothetical protein
MALAIGRELGFCHSGRDSNNERALLQCLGECSMAVIFIYVVVVLVGDGAAILVAGEIEQFSKTGSLAVFFVMFALVFWLGWMLSVHIAEKYLKIEG